MSIPRIEKSSFGEVLLPEVSVRGRVLYSPVAIKWRSGSDIVVFHKSDDRIDLPVQQLKMLQALLTQIIADASSGTSQDG